MRRSALFVASLLIGSPALRAIEPLPSERPELKQRVERGRKLYFEGTSASGRPVTALMSEENIEVPASTVPCAGCHGRDGRGGKEGGVAPSDLSWRSLTRPYDVTSASGRRHPLYDDRSLVKAIALGVDPGGNPLHIAMPRFRLSREEMQDLVAFLHGLGDEREPGVSTDSVRVGILVPREGSLAEMGSAVRATLAARFDALNRQGGLYGRKIDLRVCETAGPAEQQRSWASDCLEREEVFAGAGAFLVGADAELAGLFEEKSIPLVGPFTLDPKESFPLNRHVFYLSPGLREQARALVDYARSQPWGEKPKAWAVVAPGGAVLDEAVEAAKGSGEKAGWPAAKTLRLSSPSSSGWGPKESEALRAFADSGADPVVFLGTGAEARAFLEAAGKLAWQPHLLGAATAGEGLLQAPIVLNGKVAMALPALPGTGSEAAFNAYQSLAGTYKLSAKNVSAQLSALAAAEVLIKALELTGRDLTREKLIAQLETLRRLDTGFAPPQTFGPNQRLGARGAYVFPLDLERKALAQGGGWVEVGE